MIIETCVYHIWEVSVLCQNYKLLVEYDQSLDIISNENKGKINKTIEIKYSHRLNNNNNNLEYNQTK